MIIDLPRFIETERPLWAELEAILEKLEKDGAWRMDLAQSRRFHYLYQRVLSDLARIVTFSSEPETRRYLESLTARAYGEMNENRDRSLRFSPLKWFTVDFPRVFRKHVAFFWLSFAVFVAGGFFGAGVIAVDPSLKMVLIPPEFGHLYQTPTERVREEEKATDDRLSGEHARFSTYLMSHNIRVTILTFAMGITFGLGSMVFLFYNGILIGVIAFDYVQDGQVMFLLGWLLPHGVIEIPACLIAGQAGLLLGRTLLGRGDRLPLGQRLRTARGDLSMLIFGAALMLVWAGLIESFLSQYHQPVIPYSLKIAFGLIELLALTWFLAAAGRGIKPQPKP